jgi:hypothetical protein
VQRSKELLSRGLGSDTLTALLAYSTWLRARAKGPGNAFRWAKENHVMNRTMDRLHQVHEPQTRRDYGENGPTGVSNSEDRVVNCTMDRLHQLHKP